jgi:hypothetical protein
MDQRERKYPKLLHALLASCWQKREVFVQFEQIYHFSLSIGLAMTLYLETPFIFI